MHSGKILLNMYDLPFIYIYNNHILIVKELDYIASIEEKKSYYSMYCIQCRTTSTNPVSSKLICTWDKIFKLWR